MNTTEFHRQRGLSLVELMVAMTIALSLTASVYALYHSGKQSYREGEGMARVQESLRSAMEYLRADIQNAGAYGCGAANLLPEPATSRNSAQLSPTYLRNVLLNSGSSYSHNFNLAIQAFDTTVGGTTWTPALDASMTSATPAPVAGSDVLTLRGPETTGLTITAHTAAASIGTGTMKVWGTNELATDDIAVATDCVNATIFQITDISPAPDATKRERTLSHIINSGTPGNEFAGVGKEYRNGLLMKVSTSTYYVGASGTGRSLFRLRNGVAEELIDGVENIQLAYGFDNDGDGFADEYRTADGIDAAAWSNVISVRVDLVAASPENYLTAAIQPYVLAGTTIIPSDRRFRQAASVTIGLRNKVH